MRPLDDPAVNVRENSDSRPSERDGENKITGCSKFSCIAFFRWRHQHIFKHPSVTKLQKTLISLPVDRSCSKETGVANRRPESNQTARTERERSHGKNGGYCWAEITLAEYKMSWQRRRGMCEHRFRDILPSFEGKRDFLKTTVKFHTWHVAQNVL